MNLMCAHIKMCAHDSLKLQYNIAYFRTLTINLNRIRSILIPEYHFFISEGSWMYKIFLTVLRNDSVHEKNSQNAADLRRSLYENELS